MQINQQNDLFMGPPKYTLTESLRRAVTEQGSFDRIVGGPSYYHSHITQTAAAV